MAIKALALEGQGKTAQALQVLESLLGGNTDEELAIESYINISVRNGMHRQALNQLETLFQRAKESDEKTLYLRQMFSLEMAVNPLGSRMFDIAWRYGQLCDRTKEEEEGIFLQMFLMSTLREEIEISPEQRAEFNRRTEAFFERYPDSDFIKRVEMPRGTDSPTLKRMLADVMGITPQAERWFQRVENQLQRGELVAPFSWRPKRLLRSIPDIAYLWHVAKQSSRDAVAYHVNVGDYQDEKKANLTRGPDRTPLCDITTLILLTELDLFDLALRILGRIAIGKATLAEIQHLSHPYLGGYLLFQKMAQKLRAEISRIDQPGSLTRSECAQSRLDGPLEEVAALAATGSYVLYVDDIFARQYVGLSTENTESFTTVDLLTEAERRELISAAEASEKLAQLIEWRVGVSVQARYFLAAVPASVSGVDDVDRLTDILRSDQTYSRMIGGLWDIRHEYKTVINHWASQLAYLAASKEVRVELVAALWSSWLDKVKFRTEPALDPLHHLASSMIVAAILIKHDSVAVARLWNSFVLTVTAIHASRMDEVKERIARSEVGRVAAQVVCGKEDIEFRDRVPEILRSGLQSGTAEYDYFNRAYEAERIRLERQVGQEGS